MYNDYLDASALIISIATLLTLVRLLKSTSLEWRDIAVVIFTLSTFMFFSLIAARRIFGLPIEVILVAFTLKMIGAIGVAIHVWTTQSDEKF